MFRSARSSRSFEATVATMDHGCESVGNLMNFWIFVGGCPRSGTTLTGELVGQALGGQVVPESQFKNALLSQHIWRKTDVSRMLAHSTPFLLWDIGFEFLRELPDSLDVATLMDTVALLKAPIGMPSPRFIVDHTPSNMRVAGMLRSAFSGRCAFIHVVRNPLGVVNSVVRSDWGPSGYLRGARWWADHVSACLASERKISGDFLRVSFESLVIGTEDELARVSQWLETKYTGRPGVSTYCAEMLGSRGRSCVVNPARAVAWQTEMPAYAQRALMRAIPPALVSSVCVPGWPVTPATAIDIMRSVGQDVWGAAKERTSDRVRYRLRRRARLRTVAVRSR